MTDASEHETGYSCILEFVDPSPSFCHGFECGQLYADMKREIDPIDRTVNAESREMIVRMCASLGWAPLFQDLGDGWLSVSMYRSKRPALVPVQ
jgi:hypothetical protein